MPDDEPPVSRRLLDADEDRRDVAALADRLSALHRSLQQTSSPVLISLAGGAEQSYADWSAARDAVDQHRSALMHALDVENLLRRQLRAILDLAGQFAGGADRQPSAEISAPQTPERSVSRGWWRHRNRPPPEATTVGRGDALPGQPIPALDSQQARSPVPATPVPPTARFLGDPEPPLAASMTDERQEHDRGSSVDQSSSLVNPANPVVTVRRPPNPVLRLQTDVADEPIAATGHVREATLAACMFGRFTVHHCGRPLDSLHGHKSLTLLKYFLAQGHRVVPRDVLVELLWPEVDPEVGRRNLHQAIYALRRSLRACDPDTQYVVFRHDCYGLDDGVDIWCDVVEFEALAMRGRQHADAGETSGAIEAYWSASELYRGDFLADTPYDEWTTIDRERLRMTFHAVMDALATLLAERHQWDEAITVSQRLLRHDPLAESAHALILTAYGAKGQRSLAVQQYRICAKALQHELGLSPSPRTEALYRSLLD